MVARIPLKGVKSFYDKRVNKTYHYHRKSNKRIVAPYGTIEFIDEFRKIDNLYKRKIPSNKTLGYLIDQYVSSSQFLQKRPRTKSDYLKSIALLVDLRDMPVSVISKNHIEEWRDRVFAKHKRRAANYLVQVLSIIFSFGIKRSIIKDNPAAKIDDIEASSGEKRLNRPWSRDERNAVLAAAPRSLLGPLTMMRYLGVRIGDVRTMRNEAYQDGCISFVTQKGDVSVTLPCPAPLAAVLDSRAPHPTHLFISSVGDPWTEGGFNASFRKLKKRLEAEGRVRPGLTSHGLRHSVATDLREIGKTDREIADVLGQRTTYATPVYHRLADMTRSNAKVMGDLWADDGSDTLPKKAR